MSFYYIVATPLWPSVGVKPNTSKIGDLESFETPECLEFDSKAQNTSTLAKCGGEAQHLEKVRIWNPLGLPNVQSSTARLKTPCIGVFLVSL